MLSIAKFIADFDWIKYNRRGIFMGSRGLVPLRGRSEEGAEPPSFFSSVVIATYTLLLIVLTISSGMNKPEGQSQSLMTSLVILSSGRILSTALRLMASFGIPKTTHEASSCAMV